MSTGSPINHENSTVTWGWAVLQEISHKAFDDRLNKQEDEERQA